MRIRTNKFKNLRALPRTNFPQRGSQVLDKSQQQSFFHTSTSAFQYGGEQREPGQPFQWVDQDAGLRHSFKNIA